MQEDVLGKAYDARLMRRLLVYLRPARPGGRGGGGGRAGRVDRRARPALADATGHRPLHRDRRPRRPPRSGPPLCRPPHRRLRLRVRPDVHPAVGRAAHHAHPEDGGLRPPPAARPPLLRSQSGRPADDAGHDRRRRPQRSVRVWTDHGLRRRAGPGRHHGGDALDELAPGARRLRRPAAHCLDDDVVPQARARVVSADPRAPGPAECVPERAHHRRRHRPALRAGSPDARPIRRAQPGASRRQHPVDLLLRRVLSRDRSPGRALGRADHLDRRRLGERRPGQPRRARRVPAVLPPVLSADQRPVGKVQHPAGRHGGIRAHLHAAGYAGGDQDLGVDRDGGDLHRRGTGLAGASQTRPSPVQISTSRPPMS